MFAKLLVYYHCINTVTNISVKTAMHAISFSQCKVNLTFGIALLFLKS